jgi:hypothetical protein
MKKKPTFLIACFLMLWTPMLKAQGTIPAQQNNPRISGSPAYVKDTVTAQHKTVTSNDTAATKDTADPNKPIMGGVISGFGLLCFPLGDFAAKTNDATGYGFGASVLFNLAKRRSRAAWEQRWVNIYGGGYFQFTRLDGISDRYTIEEQTSTTVITSRVRNNMTGVGVLGRAEFFPGKLKLFIEGGAGTIIYNGKHAYEVENTPDGSSDPDDVLKTETTTGLRSDLLTNYFYGGGIRLGHKSIGLEMKVLYCNGSKAEYVDMESITFDRTQKTVSYTTQKSSTDMVIFQLGLAGRF